jgi:hypothetical protein
MEEVRMCYTRHTLAFALLLVTSPASSEWKSEYENASQERRQWFNSQQINPEAQQRLGIPFKSCCDNGDVFRTRFRVNNGGGDQWEYLDEGTWKIIPADIIKDEPSLDNMPILFKDRRTGQELCFFKPRGGI